MVTSLNKVLAFALFLFATWPAMAREPEVTGLWVAENVTRIYASGDKSEGTFILSLEADGFCASVFTSRGQEPATLKGRYRVQGPDLTIEWNDNSESIYAYKMPDRDTLSLKSPGTNLVFKRHAIQGGKLVPITPKTEPVRPVMPVEKRDPLLPLKPESRDSKGMLANTIWNADLIDNDGTRFTRSLEFFADGTVSLFDLRADGSVISHFRGTYRHAGDTLTITKSDGTQWLTCKLKVLNANSILMQFANGNRQAYARQ